MDAKKLKPFDLEAAKRGEPLVTRDGREVTEFHHFETEVREDPCAAIIGGRATWVHTDGRYYRDGNQHPYDLFMAPRKVTRWVNLYPYGEAAHHESEEVAREWASKGLALAIAIPIEIEV